MPMYDFECGECGNRFEQLSAVGTETATCPACGDEGAQMRISGFAYTRTPTANQRRRIEDKRGTNRGGARKRYQHNLDRARKQAPPPPKKKDPPS